ncbi:MAG TPA: glycosyltransferase family 87 protein [Chthoniobacteraceae bacterium]|nr:glycosyltransferase family 87 protein [Chthoniobacteraceae bacterium]
MNKSSLSGILRSRLFWKVMAMGTAVWLWNILVIVTGILVVHRHVNPNTPLVTYTYNLASAQWAARQNMYDVPETMNYMPQFAIAYTPFRVTPAPWGVILWRAVSVAVLATGLWRFVKQFFAPHSIHFFLAATLLALPLSAAATQNGQANVILAGLMLHAVAFIASGKWWPAAALTMLAIVAKPVAIVLVLLAPFFYRALRLPLAVAFAALLASPFLFAGLGYVLSQYRGFLHNLSVCSAAPEYDYADITGILWPLHVQLSHNVSLAIRASAGLLTLALWWPGARRLPEPLRAFWLFTLTAGYLMLFNPMNESNSYVVFAPALAVWALHFLRDRALRWMGCVAAFMAFSMGILPNIVRPWFGNKFALAYHPIMTFLFLAMLAGWISRGKAANSPVDSKERLRRDKTR